MPDLDAVRPSASGGIDPTVPLTVTGETYSTFSRDGRGNGDDDHLHCPGSRLDTVLWVQRDIGSSGEDMRSTPMIAAMLGHHNCSMDYQARLSNCRSKP